MDKNAVKLIRPLTEREITEQIPADLFAAMNSPPEDVFYCHVCDGLRPKKHTCVEWFEGAKEWAQKEGLAK